MAQEYLLIDVRQLGQKYIGPNNVKNGQKKFIQIFMKGSFVPVRVIASVLITKFIHYFRPLFPFYCVKIFNRSDAMLSNFALYKEKIDAKIQ